MSHSRKGALRTMSYVKLPAFEQSGYVVLDSYDQAQDPAEWLVIELQPNTYAEAVYNLHRDDNNRLNPEGTGWVVRGFFNRTDNPDSVMVLREDKDAPSTETRIPLPAGAQVIIDTQRLWHAVWHPGDEPRYCLITSWESGPELDSYISKLNAQSKVDSAPIDPEFAAKAYEEVAARVAARAAARAAQNGGMDSAMEEVKSEA